jgi:hypothetical protein
MEGMIQKYKVVGQGIAVEEVGEKFRPQLPLNNVRFCKNLIGRNVFSCLFVIEHIQIQTIRFFFVTLCLCRFGADAWQRVASSLRLETVMDCLCAWT